MCACLCWPSRLWLTSESRRPGPVISSVSVRDRNVCAPSCEWWWSELCGRKVVLRVRMPVMEQLCVVVACSVRVTGFLGGVVRLCCWSRDVAVIVVLVICTDGAPTESRLYGFHGHTRAHLLCATCCVRFCWVAGFVGRFFPEFLTVRRTLSCPWSPSDVVGCAFRE